MFLLPMTTSLSTDIAQAVQLSSAALAHGLQTTYMIVGRGEIEAISQTLYSALQDGCPAEIGNRQLVDVTM